MPAYTKNDQLGRTIKKVGTRKEKKKGVRALDKKLWAIFSKYIRIRDANSDGIAMCISCGKPMRVWYFDGKFNAQVHAGHYYTRRYKSLKYDERNVNAQCCNCNTFLEGNTQKYREGLIKKYGKNILKELDEKCENLTIWKPFVYENMIEQYQEKLNALMISRNSWSYF